MKLSQLMKGLKVPLPKEDLEIAGIAQDSRDVGKNFLFVAISGNQLDGRRFIPEAIRRGASVVVVEKEKIPELKIPQIPVPDARAFLAKIAAHFYQEPSRSLHVYGVTGTNGKTTLTYLLESILREAGRSVGVLGTIQYRFGSHRLPAPTTTPDPLSLQRILAEMKKEGVGEVVMEVSSHALVQERVEEVHFDGVAFTNLSRDHLDYHRTLDDYFEAKKLLFTRLLPESLKEGKYSVINMQDPRGSALWSSVKGRRIRVGFSAPCEVLARSFELTPKGIFAEIDLEGNFFKIESRLLGAFNLENSLVAIGLAHGAGISREAIVAGIRKLEKVPGRLESIPNKRSVHVYVDYAHTPQALANVGAAVRKICPGRLITLFGCGGDRDRGKRPEMGREASRFSDLLVVTSDNPRTEEPEKILDEILVGLREEGFPSSRLHRVTDRREALKLAVSLLAPGDTLLVAGKGHEDYQILGTEKIHFSDQEILGELLA